MVVKWAGWFSVLHLVFPTQVGILKLPLTAKALVFLSDCCEPDVTISLINDLVMANSITYSIKFYGQVVTADTTDFSCFRK